MNERPSEEPAIILGTPRFLAVPRGPDSTVIKLISSSFPKPWSYTGVKQGTLSFPHGVVARAIRQAVFLQPPVAMWEILAFMFADS